MTRNNNPNPQFAEYLPDTLYVGGTPMSYFDVGEGPTVLLLHSGGGSKLQWRALVDRLAPSYRVLAPDMPAHGLTPPRPRGGLHRLEPMVEFFSPLVEMAGGPVHIVGHSMGATYALELAAAWQDRTRSLTLAEPSAFALLRAVGATEAWEEIEAVAVEHRALAAQGDLEGCGDVFMGYWIGLEAWRTMPPRRREAVLGTLAMIADGWADAFDPRYTPERYRNLRVPTLLLRGAETTLAARTVLDVLHQTLPNRQMVEIAHAGHMAPMTHPDAVNAAILAHLVPQARTAWDQRRDVA